MATQEDNNVNGGGGGGGGAAASGGARSLMSYPDYQRDIETFQKFVHQHTILKTVNSNNNNDNNNDDVLLEPSSSSLLLSSSSGQLRRVLCYPPHLQRIKNRHYYENSHGTFVIEVPLDELRDWNAMEGGDLADRALHNTLRYQELFAQVLDETLSNMQQTSTSSSGANTAASPSTSSSTSSAPAPDSSHPQYMLRDSVDILHEQRVAQQAAHEAQRAMQNQANLHNPYYYGGAGNLPDDAAAAAAAANPAMPPNTATALGATEDFPPVLMRRYELRILPPGRRGSLPPFVHQYLPKPQPPHPYQTTATDGVSLRVIRSRSMGRLVTVRGMIVRSSDVKPCCVVATYSCDACGAELYQVVQNQREFLPPRSCPTAVCRQGGGGRRGPRKGETLHLQTRGSKFVKFQELKLQELPHQVPMGHIPRSMSVYCRGELTRLAAPGDVVTIDGVFLPQRLAESGYRAMKAGLVTTTYLEAQNIIVHKKSYDESLMDSLSEEESAQLEAHIMEIATGPDPIGKLSSSIAPEIFGHEDIKRSLLLQLVGGCTRALPDGMKIRGDINVCLMGDPGVAKSQLLKHVASIAPRGVYTTGKGSSGVGLTAAVTKDLATGEMALEGGALVLADRGICCIDEFDKMDDADRTSIHEVMEQQTVSIAKAGIIATLNARAAVLAAANPLYGRYNRSKSLSENVNLPNSLLSRFDLLFLVLDIADVDRDMALARHVTFVHQHEGLKEKNTKDGERGADAEMETDDHLADEKDETVSPRVLREYIARARKHQPVMPPDVAPYVVEAYVSLRMQDRPRARNRKESDQTVMTARQLLSILRLSQALARLRFSDFVAREDVDEAIRLTHMSKASLEDDDAEGSGGVGRNKKGRSDDVMSRIFNIIRDYATMSRSNEVELKLCEAMALRKGFTSQQLQSCLEEYEALQVIQVNRNRTHVYIL